MGGGRTESGVRRTEAGSGNVSLSSHLPLLTSPVTHVTDFVTVSEPYCGNNNNILLHKGVTHVVTPCHCVSVKMSELVTDIVNTSKPCYVAVYNLFTQ